MSMTRVRYLTTHKLLSCIGFMYTDTITHFRRDSITSICNHASFSSTKDNDKKINNDMVCV